MTNFCDGTGGWVGGCRGYVVGGCRGYVVGNYSDNNATSLPILQAEAFRFSAKLKFQDGPSVAINQSLWP